MSLKPWRESGAGALLAQMPEQGEYIRQLAYHLYTLCDARSGPKRPAPTTN